MFRVECDNMNMLIALAIWLAATIATDILGTFLLFEFISFTLFFYFKDNFEFNQSFS